MSYLQDKKIKTKRLLTIAFFGILFFVLIFFRNGIFNKLSLVSHVVFRPVLFVGNTISAGFSNTFSYFNSKSLLAKENESLRSEIEAKDALVSNYNTVADDNSKLKEILGRKGDKTSMVLASILSKPNQSPYDTLIIDVGTQEGLLAGEKVLALGNVPIGRVAEVYPFSSKVILFSSPGENTEVVINKDIFLQAIGRGGGNFEIHLAKDSVLTEGMEVAIPGINSYVLAKVVTIISDPRDSFKKALLVSPVNIQELKFVEVEK